MRDDYRCQRCGREGYHRGRDGKGRYIRLGIIKIQGDHIKELADGGDLLDLDNVQTLCVDCHKVKTAKSARLRKKAISRRRANVSISQ